MITDMEPIGIYCAAELTASTVYTMTDLTEIRRLNAQLEDLTMSALWNGVPPRYVAAVLLRACHSVVIGAEMDPDQITTELAAIADVIDTYEYGHLH